MVMSAATANTINPIGEVKKLIAELIPFTIIEPALFITFNAVFAIFVPYFTIAPTTFLLALAIFFTTSTE